MTRWRAVDGRSWHWDAFRHAAEVIDAATALHRRHVARGVPSYGQSRPRPSFSTAGVLHAAEYRSRRAGRDNPPKGQFIDVDGVRLHYVERGQGPAVVLIHGNNVWWRDFLASGLIDVLAREHRVISFDRPGFGHSERPRDRLWTPSAQARVIAAAMPIRLGRAAPHALVWDRFLKWSPPAVEAAFKRMSGVALLEPTS